MSSPFEIIVIGLAILFGFAWTIVAGYNWIFGLRGVFQPKGNHQSPILVAGPICLVLGLQCLRLAGTGLSGWLFAKFVFLGLVVDPGAMPFIVLALARKVSAFKSREQD